jgi:hypothetical protein
MDLERCSRCGRDLGLFLSDETPQCPGCGAVLIQPASPPATSVPSPEQARLAAKPVWKPPQRATAASANSPPLAASAPASAAAPASPSPRPSLPPKKEPFDWQALLCPQIVITLVCVGLAMMCLFPLGLFFSFPKGIIMLGGIGIMLWGVFWAHFRYKLHHGEAFSGYVPWFMRGSAAELGQYVVLAFQEPRVFGPPAILVVLGVILVFIPVLMPGGMPR